MIKKRWYNGSCLGSRSFEVDRKLGFVSALKHTIEGKPGTSGGPMVLSDGRVFAINAAVEFNRFYAKRGCNGKQLETYKNYFAIPSTYLKSFFSKYNSLDPSLDFLEGVEK